jgi:hypothetical protein
MTRDGTSTPDFVGRSIRGEEGGLLTRLDLQDGSAVEVCPLPARPAWDGIAVADGGVFVALRDGKLLKLGAVAAAGKSISPEE